MLSNVTWIAVNNQTPSTSYDNGDIIPVVTGGAVATDFGIRMTVDLGTLGSEYAYTATIRDYGSGEPETYYKNSHDGLSFVIQPKGSIVINLDVYPKPTIVLWDDCDNSYTLMEKEGIVASSITLQERTLYKDGAWNTLCLPFDVTDGNTSDGVSFTGTPLEGATVMSLKTSKSNGSGFDSEKGTLTLNFTDASSIQAGKPYIVRWEKPNGYDSNPSDFDIIDPTFTNVAISKTAPTPSTSYDKKVSFIGTFSPVLLQKNTTSNLYIGADNNLYYPNVDNYYVNAFRAYFHVDLGTSTVRSYNLSFGDEETGIATTDFTDYTDKTDSWYTLDGRRLNGKPTAKGLYIHGGKTVVMK